MSHPVVPTAQTPLTRLAEAVLDVLLPDRCLGCGCPHTQLCPDCRARLEAAQPFRARPAHAPPGLPETYAAAGYEGPVRQALLAHKERGALGLARPLGTALARAVCTAVPVGVASRGAPLLLVPMPSTRAATRARGHDPTRRLARRAAAVLRTGGVPARALPALAHRRRVADQAGLGAAGRLENLRGALGTAPRW
ncbi:ComF family protein, partial [Streptacidiphilus monticola]